MTDKAQVTRAPDTITYNPVYHVTYVGADPTRGYVYARLAASQATLGQEEREIIERCAKVIDDYRAHIARLIAEKMTSERVGADLVAELLAQRIRALVPSAPTASVEEQAMELLASTPHDLLCPQRSSTGFCNCDHKVRAIAKALTRTNRERGE